MKLLGKSFPNQHGRFRAIAGLLLLAYGSAGVLGYGLHAIWDCGDHCHAHVHVGSVAHAHHHDHSHGCQHHHDHAAEVVQNDDQRSSWNATDDGECPICEFLVQAQTPFALELTTVSTGPVSIPCVLHDASYVAPLLGIHAARGPPLI